jgi:hypothetical protein
MYIVYECAACCFAVMIGGTFLFAIAAACMILAAAGALAWRKYPELSQGASGIVDAAWRRPVAG